VPCCMKVGRVVAWVVVAAESEESGGGE
jgi:hypothetical protein